MPNISGATADPSCPCLGASAQPASPPSSPSAPSVATSSAVSQPHPAKTAPVARIAAPPAAVAMAPPRQKVDHQVKLERVASLRAESGASLPPALPPVMQNSGDIVDPPISKAVPPQPILTHTKGKTPTPTPPPEGAPGHSAGPAARPGNHRCDREAGAGRSARAP